MGCSPSAPSPLPLAFSGAWQRGQPCWFGNQRQPPLRRCSDFHPVRSESRSQVSKTPKLCRTRIAQDPKSHSEKRDVVSGSHYLSAIAVINWPTAALYCSTIEELALILLVKTQGTLGFWVWAWLLKVSGCVGNHRWVFVRLRIYSRGFRTWDLGFSPSEKVSDRPSVRGGNTHHCTSKQPAAGPSKDCIVDHCPRANIICIPSL